MRNKKSVIIMWTVYILNVLLNYFFTLAIVDRDIETFLLYILVYAFLFLPTTLVLIYVSHKLLSEEKKLSLKEYKEEDQRIASIKEYEKEKRKEWIKKHKTLLIVLGVIIGIIILFFGIKYILYLIKRYTKWLIIINNFL